MNSAKRCWAKVLSFSLISLLAFKVSLMPRRNKCRRRLCNWLSKSDSDAGSVMSCLVNHSCCEGNEGQQMRGGDLGVVQHGEFDVFAGGHGGGGETQMFDLKSVAHVKSFLALRLQ